MHSEWSSFFEYVCSIYSGEIAELLENTEYKNLSEELKMNNNPKAAEKKAACYYEQAAVVALKHFFKLTREIGIL